MKTPTADQVEAGANLLASLAFHGNSRPGDSWLSMESQREQFRIRALDMLTVIMNAGELLGDADTAPAPVADDGAGAARSAGLWCCVILALAAVFVWGVVIGMGMMGA